MAEGTGADTAAKRSVVGLGWAPEYGGRCSYCNYASDDGRISYVVNADSSSIRAQDYDLLVNRGWSRFGNQLCKAVKSSCCPNYAIRTPLSSFKATKSQLKAARRFDLYLRGKRAPPAKAKAEDTETAPQVDTRIKLLPEAVHKAVLSAKAGGSLPESIDVTSLDFTVTEVKPGQWQSSIPFQLLELVPTMGALAAADSVAREFSLQGVTAEGTASGTLKLAFEVSLAKESEEEESKSDTTTPHRLRLVVMRPVLSAAVFDLYKRFCVEIHGKDPAMISMRGLQNFLINSCLESPPQPHVACEMCTYFNAPGARQCAMCMSPLATPEATVLGQVLFDGKLQVGERCSGPLGKLFGTIGSEAGCLAPSGSYQFMYYLDEKLVAAGFADLTPQSFISNFLAYDPSYRWLQLGKVVALFEVYWAQQAAAHRPSIMYYNMCMYIHRCPRMNYKRHFGPCELLCPDTYQWVPFDAACQSKLDAATDTYACLADITAEERAALLDREQAAARSAVAELSILPIADHVAFLIDEEVGERLYSKLLPRLVLEIGPEAMKRFSVSLNPLLMTRARMLGMAR